MLSGVLSHITRDLNHAVAQYHRGPLRDDYLYLFLDAVVLKVRDLTAKVRRRMVLVAYGVLPNGRREILAYQFAQGESEAAWVEFLQDLFLRGLQGKNLRLIVSDGGQGLRAALPAVYPRIPRQLCKRNATAHRLWTRTRRPGIHRHAGSGQRRQTRRNRRRANRTASYST